MPGLDAVNRQQESPVIWSGFIFVGRAGPESSHGELGNKNAAGTGKGEFKRADHCH
jgi:hypothetical protein